jgi:hypothetical protein
MHRVKQLMIVSCAILGLAVFFWLGSELPRTTTELFASPDETATLAFGRAWTWSNGFRLPNGLHADLSGLASLHARSTVRQGDWLLPVGFLGMPFIAAILDGLIRGLASYFTVILFLSSMYPLWQITKRVSGRVATLTVLLTLSFPTVILYMNRGLFPNLPVVALVLWAVWARMRLGTAADRQTGRPATMWLVSIVAGLSLGFALLIRPTEAIWIVPWVAWASLDGIRNGDARKYCASTMILTIAVCLTGAFLSYQTYQPLYGVLPSFGYAVRDSAGDAITTSVQTDVNISDLALQQTLLPFGFHPRAMWNNVRIFLFNVFSLWMAVALFGAYFALKKKWERQQTVVLALMGWTAASLLLVYGQSLYADNIRGTMTLGNSFLRYLLPLAPLLAFGSALLVDWVWEREDGHADHAYRRVIAIVIACMLALLGILTAYAGDEEGILQTEHELQRYSAIRLEAEKALPPGTIILSERSDKIFVSDRFVAVSPFPDHLTIDALARSSSTVAIFHRILTPDEEVAWSVKLYGRSLQPVFAVDNEEMYLVK